MNSRTVDTIRKASFFAGLSDRQCSDLSRITCRRTLGKRETLFLEETTGSSIFLLDSGCVQLSKVSQGGDDIVIRTVKPGEVFAEVILFERPSYPVTAVAVAPSEVLAFDRRDIRHLLRNAEFRDAFISSLMRKQRYLAERVRYLTSYDVEQRFFLFLREHYGESQRITVEISKKDIAAAIGATPETFSRLIKRLKDQGAIVWQGNIIEVPQK